MILDKDHMVFEYTKMQNIIKLVHLPVSGIALAFFVSLAIGCGIFVNFSNLSLIVAVIMSDQLNGQLP